MSAVKRKGLEFALNQIGKAIYAYESLVGDTFTPDTYIYDFENNLIKTRGSKIFNDYDLSRKDPYSELTAEFNTFDSLDVANFVLQGGDLKVKSETASFANTGSWNPNTFSPISPEGWGIYDYNAWSNFIPKYNSSGLANTNYIIYNPLSEPGTGISRTFYDYPIRFSGYGLTYERVPFFNYGRWISIKNNTVLSDIPEIEFIINKNNFSGSLDINPYNNTPLDLAFYSHRYLISTSIDDPIYLVGSMGILGSSEKLTSLAYQITESTVGGNTDVSVQKDYYKINITLPSSTIYSPNSWFHFIAYWGSQDSYISTIKSSFASTDYYLAEIYEEDTSSIKLHSRKNFFTPNVKSSLEFIKSGIFDTSVYLYNNNNLFINNEETKYNPQVAPFRYKLNENINGSSIGKTNSLLGFSSLEQFDYLPFVIAVKDSGTFYDQPEINLEIFYETKITESDIPENWKDFEIWPTIPDGFNIISKIVGKYSNLNNSLLVDNEIVNDLDIIYIEVFPKNVIKKGISDPDIAKYFTGTLFQSTNNIRNKDFKIPFKTLAQRLLLRFSGYSLSQVTSFNQFTSLENNQYQVLHNLIKLPKNSNFISSDYLEPVAFQFNKDASNLISDFASIPPSIYVAGYASSFLYNNSYTFSNTAEFEVYYEKNDDEIDNHTTDTANGLENDYSFKIQFLTSDNQYVTKNIYVNASKFYISQLEYQNRLNKNLSVDGYFTSQNINEISDFKKYSYSGLIPDLKMGEFRKIENKQNSPIDSERLTEEEYETILKSENANITKDEIIIAKSGFGLTNSFYEIDTKSPTNFYKKLNDIGITISKYSDLDSYWIDNVSHLYGNDLGNNIFRPLNIKDLRYDSFIISESGLTASDNSIQQLENTGYQQIISGSGTTLNKNVQSGVQNINSKKIALRIHCDQTQEIKSFKVKLKSTSDYFNLNSTIRAEIYSNKNDKPFELLKIGSSLNLNQINENLEDYYFYIDYKLFENITYWIVLNISQLPPQYDPYIKGLANVGNTSVTGIYNSANDTFTEFNRYKIGSEIGFGSSSGIAITNWYQISSIGSSTSLIFSGSGFTNTKLDYAIKYNFQIGICESSAVGASANLSTFSATGWSSYLGTGYVEFYKPDNDIYAAFNKNFENSTLILPSANKYREKNNYKVSEYFSFTNKINDPAINMSIYPRSIYLKKIEFVGTGISNTNRISVSNKNYKNQIMIGIGISQSSCFSAGTSITSIIYDSSNQIYNVYLSSNILNNFSEDIVGTATSQNIYIKRANDINLKINYDTVAGLASTTITLPKSPTWITKWYIKNKSKFNLIDRNIKADLICTTHDLKFENLILSENNYLNGFAEFEGSPKASLGTTFDFKFVSSNGVRVFVNDNIAPDLDNWLNIASIGNTFSKNLISAGETIKFTVEFNHNNSISGVGATLIGYYKKRSDSSWSLIDDNFYQDVIAEEIILDTNEVFKINFMNVSDNIDTFNTITYGSPINDKIVIRSN